MSQRSRLLVGRDDLEGPMAPKVPRALEEMAIYDLTNKCYDAFERLVDAELIRGLHNDDNSGATPHDLPGLKNSFAFWVDHTGALAPIGASLDDRLADYVDIKEMVIQLLEMVKRNIDQRVSEVERVGVDMSWKSSDWDHSLLSIGAALDRLHFLASAIRKASVKSISGEDILLNFANEEEILKHLGSTIVIRRKILSKRAQHEEKLAIRRTDLKPTSLQVEEQGQSMEPLGPRQLLGMQSVMEEKDTLPKQLGAMTEVTQASKLNPDLALKYINQKRPTLSIRSSGTSTRDDSLAQRYPSLPMLSPGATHTLCPYCRKPLRSGELSGSRAVQFWENHVDGDLQPYSCLFAQCLGAFFIHRSDWAQHMKTTHGANWPRNVHCVTWFCDIGHPDIAEFDNEIEWRAHVRNIESHPGRKKQPTDIQLQALAIKKQQVALRDEFVCPLCEEIPEKISVLGCKGNRDELFKILEDHIACHIKDLSFMSLPALNDEPKDEVVRDATTSGGFRGQLSRTGSALHSLSLSGLMENVLGPLGSLGPLGYSRASTPDSNTENMALDTPQFDTEIRFECSDCQEIDYFTYTVSEDESCCKHCGHQICDECEEE
ncbi:hypothetical protein NUW58_g6688 [Xylaria curta]|uniref:Uncharacterized protein n=1 Tax=Xylaria curta TaxID=42375 RepID=A0ACC1NQ43_9PEZI|nr:hypothetical protein NUW58_g6688 [Xylaria curta]